jgi:hypothetical protein
MTTDETRKSRTMGPEWAAGNGASDLVIRNSLEELNRTLPEDYLGFIRTSDGGEGFIGRNYLILWKIGELKQFNLEYEVDQYASGLLLFGSNGGGVGYAFDTRDGLMRIVRVPFVGMDLRYARPVAETFSTMLEKLADESA